jgi:ATP-dependent Clp protease adaptor protein ClpS
MKDKPIFSSLEEPIIEYKSEDKKKWNNEIVLFNDDVNTFEHVINCLVDVCQHNREQAEQCAWIVHLKGKCVVKVGSYNKLLPICISLLDKGLSAEIS